MSSKHRVFSHTNDTNYIDYTQNKKGVEILKTVKKEYNNADNEYKESRNNLNRFKNQEEFLTLSKSYYNYLNTNECVPEFVKNMYNSNASYVIEDTNIEEQQCNNLNSPLYPYGKMETNNKCNFFYPYKIDIRNWCSDKKPLCQYNENENEKYPVCLPQPVIQNKMLEEDVYDNMPNYAEPNYAPSNYAQPNYAQPNYAPSNYAPSKPIYIPTPIYLPNYFQENNTSSPHEQCEIKQKCNKCKTSICKKGLCQTCNQNKNCQKCNNIKKCHCRRVNHTQIHNYSGRKKILKTGISF